MAHGGRAAWGCGREHGRVWGGRFVCVSRSGVSGWYLGGVSGSGSGSQPQTGQRPKLLKTKKQCGGEVAAGGAMAILSSARWRCVLRCSAFHPQAFRSPPLVRRPREAQGPVPPPRPRPVSDHVTQSWPRAPGTDSTSTPARRPPS